MMGHLLEYIAIQVISTDSKLNVEELWEGLIDSANAMVTEGRLDDICPPSAWVYRQSTLRVWCRSIRRVELEVRPGGPSLVRQETSTRDSRLNGTTPAEKLCKSIRRVYAANQVLRLRIALRSHGAIRCFCAENYRYVRHL